MPTRRITETIDPDEGLTAETAVQVMRTHAAIEDPNAETDEEFALLNRMRGLLDESDAARVVLKLYRLTDGPKRKYGWCADYAPEDYEMGGLAMIRETWGPGEYQLRLMGARGLAKVLPVQIEPDATRPLSMQHNAPQVSQQNSELAQVLKGLQETQAVMLQALTQRPDPMEAMRNSMALIGSMREAFGLGGAQAAPAQPVNQMTQLKEMMEVMRGLKDTARELNDDDKPAADPSDPMSMLPGVIDLVKTAMSNQPQQTVPQLMPPIHIPASVERATLPTVQENPAQQPEAETVEMLLIRGLIEDLLQLAIDGKPATAGAEFIFEKLPDEMIDAMQNRYWFEIIAMRFPIVKPHEAWLREAKAEADKLFEEEEANQPDSGDAG